MLIFIYLTLLQFISFIKCDSYCPIAPNNPQDRRKDNTTLRIAQFNAEWLFVNGYDNCPGSTCPWKDDEMAKSHVSAIANVIAEINPDIINLAEVESCDELNDLLNEPSLSGYGYEPYMVEGKDTSTGQDVGILTKIDPLESLYRTETKVSYPISISTCKSNYTGTQGVSKHYITSVNVNNINIAIIGLHFLAFPDDPDRCVQREAQATVIQSIIAPYIEKGYEIIILGDMNDWDNQDIDTNNNVPISQVLDLLKGNVGNVSWRLQNIAGKLTQSERYTCWYDSNYDCIYKLSETSMIDHILVSDGLYSLISSVSIEHSLYYQQCSTDFYYSDHWPVVVDFKFN